MNEQSEQAQRDPPLLLYQRKQINIIYGFPTVCVWGGGGEKPSRVAAVGNKMMDKMQFQHHHIVSD